MIVCRLFAAISKDRGTGEDFLVVDVGDEELRST
jgi:hypothetical protein